MTIEYKPQVFKQESVTLVFGDSPYALKPTDHILLADCTLGNIAINLLASPLVKEQTIIVKKIDPTVSVVTITPNGAETIDGEVNIILSTQWTAITLHCNGTNWFII